MVLFAVLLVGCGLTAQPLAGIIHAISSNPQVSDITLDISGNILDSKSGMLEYSILFLHLFSCVTFVFVLLIFVSECELLFGKSMADAKNIYSLVLR